MTYHPDAPMWSPGPARATAIAVSDAIPTLMVVAPESDLRTFSVANFTQVATHTTGSALQQVTSLRPGLVIVDLDHTTCDGYQVCRTARDLPATTILVITAQPERVPPALKAGCHAVLLKPFAPNLLAARVGRLMRERQQQMRMRSLRVASATADGTNRVWEAVSCPNCGTGGATSFEFHSHRRMWFACLGCNSVWLGPRKE